MNKQIYDFHFNYFITKNVARIEYDTSKIKLYRYILNKFYFQLYFTIFAVGNIFRYKYYVFCSDDYLKVIINSYKYSMIQIYLFYIYL